VKLSIGLLKRNRLETSRVVDRKKCQQLPAGPLEGGRGHSSDTELLGQGVQELLLLDKSELEKLGSQSATGSMAGLQPGVEFRDCERTPIQQNFAEAFHVYDYMAIRRFVEEVRVAIYGLLTPKM
jgi:hypothetical protein